MNGLVKLGYRIFQKGLGMAMYFIKWNDRELIQGENSILSIAKILKNKNLNNVLVITDKILMDLKLLDGMFAEMSKEGIFVTIYDSVVPNPTTYNVEDALALYNKNECKAIIAFGGGSPMDCAKGVAARVAMPKKSLDQLRGLLKITKKVPPLFAVPTTSGTGSEVTLAAVIKDESTLDKYVINDPHLIPKYCVLDPMLTVGLPQKVTSTTGMDALTHAVEAYIGKVRTSWTKEKSIEAAKLIYKSLYRCYTNGNDVDARIDMQLAAHYAGVAFTRAFVGYVHAIAHALGGQYGIPHGLANAVILPYVLDWYGDSIYKPISELATSIGITGINEKEQTEKFIQWIRDMNKKRGIPEKITGIKPEDIPEMVAHAQKEAHPLYPVPKFMDLDNMTEMFRTIIE